MTDPSADRPPLFTDQDVELVADALTASNVKRWEQQLPVPAWCELAMAAVRALADAGRLAPVSAEHREQWGVRLVWDDGVREPDDFEAANRADAEHRFGAHVLAKQRDPRWRVTPRLIRRVRSVGPWVEVDENTGGTDD